MRRAAKIDDNQRKIVNALRKVPNLTVAITSQSGNGFPDIVVGYKKYNYLIELKDGAKSPSQQKLRDAQQPFKDNWTGQYDVCNSLEQVLDVIRL